MFVLCGFYDPSWGTVETRKRPTWVEKGKTLIRKTAALNSSIVKEIAKNAIKIEQKCFDGFIF